MSAIEQRYAKRARHYDRRAESYYASGMRNAGDRARRTANMYWGLAERRDNPLNPTTRDVLIGIAAVGALGVAFLAYRYSQEGTGVATAPAPTPVDVNATHGGKG